jgi:hypothetical protein
MILAIPMNRAGAADVVKTSDPAFEKFVDMDALANAWVELNAALLADAGLQLAEGERVLFRSHPAVTADQVLSIAAKIAGEKKDVKTLARLARAADAFKKADLAALVAAAQRIATKGGANPALAFAGDRTSPEVFLAVRDYVNSIIAAKVSGDGETLDIMIQLTPTVRLPETQRKYLIKAATEARDSLPNEARGLDPAATALHRMVEGDKIVAESETLGIKYAGAHNGLRVTGISKDGAAPLAKGDKLQVGNLIISVGDVPCYGNDIDIDDLVENAGTNQMQVYDPRTRKVRTCEWSTK